jgi:type IV secretory pathway VirB10-like protein
MTPDTVWKKITGELPENFGRAGLIPVYVGGTWILLRNTYTIYLGVEQIAEPEKVDRLRQNVVELMAAFPDTIPQLEKLGVRVKQLLNKTITSQADVITWAGSLFNQGPADPVPPHVRDAMALVPSDLTLQVKPQTWVLPDGEEGSRDFTLMDGKVFGPQHEYTRTLYRRRKAAVRLAQKEERDASRVHRPRGRPRADGLVPGSDEAKAADKAKRKVAQETAKKERAKARKAGKLATITKLPERRRVLKRGTPVALDG